MKEGPHEARFCYNGEGMQLLGHMIFHSPPNFRKTLPRSDILVKKKDLYMMDYDFNSEVGKSPLSKGSENKNNISQ